MALKVQIKPGQKVVINGAVLENVTTRSVSLLVHNRASLLREQDILPPGNAQTPATRVYFELQCLYLFPEDAERHKTLLNEYLGAYRLAAPSASPLIDEVESAVAQGQLFQGLKAARKLLEHEGRVFEDVNEKLSQRLHAEYAADSGKSSGD